MSGMAKIFVVVNLILAVAAFGSAATLLGAQDDYKTAYQDVLKKSETTIAAIEKERDDAESARDQQTAKASAAVASQRTAEGQNQSAQRTLAELRSANEKLQTSVETYSKELGALRTQIENNAKSLTDAAQRSRDATTASLNAKKALQDEVTNRVRLEQDVSRMQEAVQTLAAEKGDLEASLRQANFELDQYRKRVGPLSSGGQGSEGRVLNVRGNLVQISVGSQDGVRIGDTYHIRRGSSYVGTISIDKVFKDQSVGTFDDVHKGSGAPPQRNDVAYPDN